MSFVSVVPRIYTGWMRRLLTTLLTVALAVPLSASGVQRRKAPAKKPVPAGPVKTVTPDIKCPSLIGMGVKTVRSFCDVPAGRDPASGIIVTLPPHAGEATLSFDLHARHL